MANETDDYVEHATTFDASDVTDRTLPGSGQSKQEHYRRLSRANTLRWNGEWEDQTRGRRQDRRAIFEAVQSSLELTPHQKARSRQLFAELSTDLIQAYDTATVALAVCATIGYEDGRGYHPNNLNRSQPPSRSETEQFVRVASENGVRYNELYRCWNKVNRVK